MREGQTAQFRVLDLCWDLRAANGFGAQTFRYVSSLKFSS